MEKKLHHQFYNTETLEVLALPKDNFLTIGECILYLIDCFGEIQGWEYRGCGMW